MRNILNRRVGGRDGDVAGLPVVELLEEVCGDDGVVSDEGVVFMVSRCWGVDGRVRVSGHVLVMEDAEGVPTEGSMGLVVLDGGRALLWFASPGPLSQGGGLGRVGFGEVPSWRGKVPVESWRVEGVVAVSLVGRGRSQDGGCFSLRDIAAFICSTGT